MQIMINVTDTELTVSGTEMSLFMALGILDRAKDSVKAEGFDTLIVPGEDSHEKRLEASLRRVEDTVVLIGKTVSTNAQPEQA